VKEENSNNEVDVYYGHDKNVNCKLHIIPLCLNSIMIDTPIKIIYDKEIPFLFFDEISLKNKVYHLDNDKTLLANDIIFSSFYLLTGWNEKFINRDKKDRHNIQQSFLYQNNLLHTPIVNKYADILLNVFSKSHRPLPSWPYGKKYAVALSHDIDYPVMIKWIEAIRYCTKNKPNINPVKIFDILFGKETFWNFEKCMKLETTYCLKSAFYFCGYKGNLLRYLLYAPDPFYDVSGKKFSQVFETLKNHGFEIGMHASYLAYKSVNSFKAEKQKIESVLGKNITGNRHHYWHWNQDDAAQTSAIHNEIGLVYDSSICFEKHSGFRYGISSPFHLYDSNTSSRVDTLQLPPSLMDAQLFDFRKESKFTKYEDMIDSLINNARSSSGVFVVDFHPRTLNNTLFPEWGDSYKYLLNAVCKNDDFFCDTPGGIANYWLEREKKLLEASR